MADLHVTQAVVGDIELSCKGTVLEQQEVALLGGLTELLLQQCGFTLQLVAARGLVLRASTRRLVVWWQGLRVTVRNKQGGKGGLPALAATSALQATHAA